MKNRNLLYRLAVILFLVFILADNVFAYDESKVNVHKTDLSQFNFDVGLSINIPLLSSDGKKTFGIFSSVVFTPIRYNRKLSLGLKFNTDVTGLTAFFKDFSKAKVSCELDIILRYLLKKSLEVYMGGGAQIFIYNYNGIKDFNQKFGISAQAGVRGRLNDVIGLGLEGSLIISDPHVEDEKIVINKEFTSIAIRGFLSVEF